MLASPNGKYRGSAAAATQSSSGGVSRADVPATSMYTALQMPPSARHGLGYSGRTGATPASTAPPATGPVGPTAAALAAASTAAAPTVPSLVAASSTAHASPSGISLASALSPPVTQATSSYSPSEAFPLSHGIMLSAYRWGRPKDAAQAATLQPKSSLSSSGLPAQFRFEHADHAEYGLYHACPGAEFMRLVLSGHHPQNLRKAIGVSNLRVFHAPTAVAGLLGAEGTGLYSAAAEVQELLSLAEGKKSVEGSSGSAPVSGLAGGGEGRYSSAIVPLADDDSIGAAIWKLQTMLRRVSTQLLLNPEPSLDDGLVSSGAGGIGSGTGSGNIDFLRQQLFTSGSTGSGQSVPSAGWAVAFDCMAALALATGSASACLDVAKWLQDAVLSHIHDLPPQVVSMALNKASVFAAGLREVHGWQHRRNAALAWGQEVQASSSVALPAFDPSMLRGNIELSNGGSTARCMADANRPFGQHSYAVASNGFPIHGRHSWTFRLDNDKDGDEVSQLSCSAGNQE